MTPPPPPITAHSNTTMDRDESPHATLQQPMLAARQQQHRTPSPCPLATFATKTTAASSSPAAGPLGVITPAAHGQAPPSSHHQQSGGESPSPLAPPVKLTAAQKKAERHAAAAAVSSSMGKSPSQAATGRRQQQPKHSLHHHHHEWQPSTLMRWYRDNQIELPLAILTLLLAGAAIAPPSASSYFHNIVLPAYPLTADRVARHPPNSTSPGPATNLYAKGPCDVAFVVFGIIIWTLVRAVTIDHVLKPLARKLKCTRSHVERFGEQGWLGLYYSVSWSIGMWFVYRSPFWMNVEQFWIDYPHEYLSGEFKAYYLLQLAFWIQQVLVIHIEKPRKDYTQMLVHHFVTCALIISSYYTNFTRVGCAILATMDVGDIFLSTAKCLNYIRWRKTCDAMFVAFVGVWIYSRHYVYNVIVASIYRDIPKLLSMEYEPERGHYMSWPALYFFLALLGTLQVLLLIWLYMIFRVIVKVVRGSSAEDTRSDEESGAEDEEEEEGVETDKVAEPKKFK